MRHRKAGLKLSKTVSHRDSMFKNMVTSLFKFDRIRTTDVRAKELRRWADHVITLAKRGDLHARRQVLNIIRDKKVVHDLFEGASEKYSHRAGGYTRIVKIGYRAGDSAPISLIELVDSDKTKKKEKSRKKSSPVSAAAPALEKDVRKSAVDGTGKEETAAETQFASETAAPEATIAQQAASEENVEDSAASEDEKPAK